MALAYGWRVSCDVKVLLYESHTLNPDAQDLAKVTNYLVWYASKGAESTENKKAQLRAIVMSTDETTTFMTLFIPTCKNGIANNRHDTAVLEKARGLFRSA
jgi:hypothetical protein